MTKQCEITRKEAGKISLRYTDHDFQVTEVFPISKLGEERWLKHNQYTRMGFFKEPRQ